MGSNIIPRSYILLCLVCLVACTTKIDQTSLSQRPENSSQNNTDTNIHLPTLFIAGDSTAAKGKGESQTGWAEPLAEFFDKTKVNIVNRARGGRSSRTFITEGHWDAILKDLKPGDVVLIQFGHNDGGKINDPLRARGSLPGLGEAQQTIDNIQTGQEEVVYTYGHYMRKMVADVKARDAIPVLLSLTVRNIWQDGRIERGSGRYGAWSYELAWVTDTAFIDVTNTVADQFELLGEEQTSNMYPQDHTHFNAAGAALHAQAVMAGLKGIRLAVVDTWLSEMGKRIAKDANAWLRLPFPNDRNLPSVFLIGDSTVRNGGGDGAGGQWGWGDYLGQYFDRTKINVVNRAVGGLSSRTYYTYGHWQRALNMMLPGDFVLMQFGHNDAAPLNDTERARGTIKGVGSQAEQITNLLTGEPEQVHSYGWYLETFIRQAQAKGATPIVCSPVPRKSWNGNTLVRAVDSYPQWAATVASRNNVEFIDLHELVAKQYDRLGPQKVETFFADTHTHTSASGAQITAGIVARAIQASEEAELKSKLKIEMAASKSAAQKTE